MSLLNRTVAFCKNLLVISSDPMEYSYSFKPMGHEADHSTPASAKVSVWSYASTPQYAFMALCLVKHRDNFIFFLKPVLPSFSFCISIKVH
jgi:hypothetical protein